MELDVIYGNPADVRSLVCAALECDSLGVYEAATLIPSLPP